MTQHCPQEHHEAHHFPHT